MSRSLIRRRFLFACSTAIGAVGLVLITIAVFLVIWPRFVELREVNTTTFGEVHCKVDKCDARELGDDPAPADYLLIKSARFFILNSPRYRDFWLNASDVLFVAGFRRPADFHSIIGDDWKLYSERAQIDHRPVEVMVGYRAPWKLGDEALRDATNRIVSRLSLKGNEITLPRIQIDGVHYGLFDANTGRIIYWSGDLPAFLPKHMPLPKPGVKLYREGSRLFVVRTDDNGALVASSLNDVINLWLLASAAGAACVLGFVAGHVAARTVLREYLIFYRRDPIAIDEALRSGESQNVEFKRGIVEEDLLKSVTAFANTNDGTIFVGVDDHGRISGLEMGSPKEKDTLKHRLYSVIRRKITPLVFTKIDFEEVRGYVIARIFVPRGDEPLYFLEGVIYVRYGESDILAEPALVKQILTTHRG